MKTFILILFIFYSLCSCIDNAGRQELTSPTSNYPDPYLMINDGRALLKEGDLIVRLNEDPTSQFIKNFNRYDKSYSHAGIVLYENGYPYIYHIVNGEENPDQKLRKDSLNSFCNPRKNIAYGIFRYDINPIETQQLKEIIYKWYAKGVQFDPTFNLKTNDKMYCSEMLMKALALATDKRIMIQTTKPTSIEAKLFSLYSHLSFAYTSKLQIISIDNLYINPFCHLIKEYRYKTDRRI